MVIVAFLIGWFLRTMIKGGLVEGYDIEVDSCESDITLEKMRKLGKSCNHFFEDHWYSSGGQCTNAKLADHLGVWNEHPCKRE